MDGYYLVPALALVTLGIVIVLAVVSKRRTDARHDDPKAPKSTLASDTPSRSTPDGNAARDAEPHRAVEPKLHPPQPAPPKADVPGEGRPDSDRRT